jgi:hypothetical protein
VVIDRPHRICKNEAVKQSKWVWVDRRSRRRINEAKLMPMLLEDLAEETSASNRRAADRLDAEARELDDLRMAKAVLENLRQRVVDSARQATDYVVSRSAEAEGVWRSALALRMTPTGDDAERLLRNQLEMFESARQLVRSARSLWRIPERMGVAPERLDELDRAEERLTKLAAETKKALEHRTSDWQPADPARLALGLQMSRQGKTVTAKEAKERFSPVTG